MKRVVVTGIGIVSSIGNNQQEVKDSLYHTKSGILFDEDQKKMGFRSCVSGQIKIDLENSIERKFLRFMGDGASYNYLSMLEAIKDSNLSEDEISNNKTSEKNTAEETKSFKNAPSAEKIMKEKNIDPKSLKGSGRDGRIMKEDVMSLPNNQNTKTSVTPSMGSEEKVKMTRLRQTIARRLKESQNTAAMLTTYNEADMTAILKIRSEFKDQFFSKHGVKLGFMSFFVKACCKALEEVPEVNAQIDGDYIIYKQYVNMGVAVGTDNGLVVPVLKNADAMSFSDIEKEINKMGLLARDGKLSMADMTGGTFTISNGGIYGSLMSSPILNSPESGILGMHKIQERPMAIDGKIEILPMMYLALSYDHRIVDGKGAVTFLVRVKENLEDPRRLLIDL